MNNNSFSHDNSTQLALSYELLHLLRWLEQHDVEKLKKIISKAVAHGLHDEIQRTRAHVNHAVLEEMHLGIVDFFEIMDHLLDEAITEHVEKKARAKNLLPTLDHFDGSLLDHETVRTSIENTTKQLDAHPHINAKEQWCKELLKQWEPLNSDCMN
jgi:hypothetical protein